MPILKGDFLLHTQFSKNSKRLFLSWLKAFFVYGTIFSLIFANTASAFVPMPEQPLATLLSETQTPPISQDLSWGVLAINPDKPIYQVGEQANIAMAVLNSKGLMACDAQLELAIYNLADKEGVLLSTDNGGIQKNPECEIKDYVTKPDFEAAVVFSKTGTYALQLTAATKAGKRSITDYVSVQNKAPYSIKRLAPTRLYPAADYPVAIEITAEQDFSGLIIEQLPASFQIIGKPANSTDLFSDLQRIVEGTDFSPAPVQAEPAVTTKGEKLVIEFPVALKAGESAKLSYTFHAPPTSPEFYSLGPLSFFSSNQESLYAEPRAWQLANDAVEFRASSTAAGVASGNITINSPAGVQANDILIVGITADDNVAVTVPSGWTVEIATNNGTGLRSTVAWSRATSTQSGWAWTFGHTSGSTALGGIVAFSGAITSGNPFSATTTKANSASHTITASGTNVSIANSAAIFMGHMADDGSNANTIACSDPSALTEILDEQQASFTDDVSLVMGWAAKTTTGQTGNCTDVFGDPGGTNVNNGSLLILQPYPITVSGKIYSDEGVTNLGAGKTVTLLTNGGSPVSTTTTSGGNWSLANLNSAAGTVFTVYLNGDPTYKANRVFVSNGANATTSDLYANRLILGISSGQDMTNAHLATGASSTSDIIYSVASNNLTVNSGYELHIDGASAQFDYNPGGTVTTQGSGGDLHILNNSQVYLDTATNTVAGNIVLDYGCLNINASTNINGGNIIWNTGACLSYTSGTPTVTVTGPGEIQIGTFYNLVIAGTGTVSSTVISKTVNNNFIVNPGATYAGTYGTTVNGTVGGDGTIGMTGGTFLFDGTGNFGGNTDWSFYNLTFGDGSGVSTTTAVGTGAVTVNNVMTVASSQILDAGAKQWKLSGPNNNPLAVNGALTASTSTFSFQATSSTVTIPGLTYYNLDFSPSQGSPTFALGTLSQTWNLATTTLSEMQIDSLVFDSTNGVMYAGTKYFDSTDEAYYGKILRCAVSTGCQSAGNWTVATTTKEYGGIISLVWDSANSVIYAGGGTSKIYRCATACNTPGNWTVATTAPESIYSLVFDSANNVIYAGGGSNGAVYRCAVSTGCQSAGNWTLAVDTPDAAINSLAFDSTNNAIYAGGGLGFNGKIYKCVASTGCTSAGNWTAVIVAPTFIISLTFDSTNNAIYAGSSGGKIYKCVASTGCTSAGNWFEVNSFAGVPVNALTFDAGNNMVYAGIGGPNIYRCSAGSGCGSAGYWSVATATPEVGIKALAMDTTNKVVYAGTESYAGIYKGLLPTASAITANNNLTIGGNGAATVDAVLGNPVLDINGGLTIGDGDTFIAPGSSTTTIAGDLTINGTFTHSGGTLTLDTTATSTITSAVSTAFNNLKTITPNKVLQFKAASSTDPVFTIDGTFTVTGTSGNNVKIQSDTPGSKWLVYFNSPQSNISYATIKDSGCELGSAIATTTNSTNAGNNGNCWGFVSTVSISGTVYDTDETSSLNSAMAIKMIVSPGTSYSTTTLASNGAFSFANIPQPATNTLITIFLDTNGGNQAALVFRYGNSCTGVPNCTGLSLIKDRLLIDNKGSINISNSDLAPCDNDTGNVCNDTDIGFTSNSGALSLTYSTNELKIASSTTFSPEGDVTAQKLDVAGVYAGNAETITLTGVGTSASCSNTAQYPLCISGTFTPSGNTVKYTTTTNTSILSTTYHNLQLQPSAAGSPTYTLEGGSLNVNEDLTIGNGTNPVTVLANTNNPIIDVNGSITIATSSSFTASASSALTVGGSFINSGTFTHSTSTVILDAVVPGFVMSGNLNGSSAFYNLTFNGSGGEWTLNAPLLVSNNLTVSAGNITGSNNVTVNGGNVTGNGSLNLTGGTFLLDGTGSFGGSSAWTFNNLIFGDGSGAATTTSAGAGGITVNGTTTIAGSQILDLGTKIWTLKGATPLVISGDFVASTSVVSYASVSALEIPPLNYYNLYLKPAASVTYTLGTSTGQTLKVDNDFIIGNGSQALTVTAGTYNPNLDLRGNFTIAPNSVYIKGSGTVTFKKGASQTAADNTALGQDLGAVQISANGGNTSINLAGNLKVTSMTVDFGQTLSLNGANTLTLTGSGTPFTVNGAFAPSLGTVAYTSNSNANITAATYYNLTLAPSVAGSPIYTLATGSSQTLTVNGNLVIGDGTNPVSVAAHTYNPSLIIAGHFTNSANATTTASASGLFSISGHWTNSGVFVHNSGTVTFDGSEASVISGSTTFNNFIATSSGKTLKFQRQLSGAPVFTFNGTFTLTGSPNNNIHLESDVVGSKWLTHFNTAQSSITHTRIRDSGCDAGTAAVLLLGSGSKDDGNNENCWVFSSSIQYEGGGGSSGGSQSSEGGSGGGNPQGGGGEGGLPPGGEGGSGGGNPQGGGGEGGFIPSNRHFANYDFSKFLIGLSYTSQSILHQAFLLSSIGKFLLGKNKKLLVSTIFRIK